MKKIRKIALFGMGGTYWIGGAQYLKNIVHAINTLNENETETHFYIFKDERQNFSDLTLLDNVKVFLVDINSAFPEWTLKNRIQWFVERKFFKRIVPRYENYFIEHGFDFVFPVAASRHKRLSSAAWIADFQYHHFPNEASEEFTRAAHHEISHIAANASKIILSSLACENDCHTIFPHTQGKTYAMPFTVFIEKKDMERSNFDEIRLKYDVPGNFLMVSNSFCPTKNHKVLFQALSILRKKGVVIPVLCTGNIVDQRNLHFANETLVSLTALGIRHQVHLLGIIPRADQISLYRMSRAIVQPSLNEGWSTSIEEAKALGKKLIVSDIAVHQEQVLDKRYMFRASDADHMAQVIQQLWTDTDQQHFPDVVAEKQAFTEYGIEIRKFANRFLEISQQ